MFDRYDIEVSPYFFWKVGLMQVGRFINFGSKIYSRDWNVLVIIDACRYDLFKEFAPRHQLYDIFESVQHFYSCASTSKEWLQKNFEQGPVEEVRDTVYVTGNGFSQFVDTSDLAGLLEVWRYSRDPDLRITPPKAVTDAAIQEYRTRSPDKLVVHYEQPHAPFLHSPSKYDASGDGRGGTQDVWEGLRKGRYDKDKVWEDYGKNLLTVLDDVETLIENVSGTVVVSSDHGNAMGKWGVYGHPKNVPVPVVKKVPWAVTEGLGNDTYELPKDVGESDVRIDDSQIKDHLKDLGYNM